MLKDQKRQQISTSWEEIGFTDYGIGIRAAQFSLGTEGDESNPIIMRGSWAPGVVVPPHTHNTDYTEIILSGSQQVTREWHYPGDVRIVKAGTVYGPLVAGPEGVEILIVFRDSHIETIGMKTEDADKALDATV
jgi:hypothetical protein